MARPAAWAHHESVSRSYITRFSRHSMHLVTSPRSRTLTYQSTPAPPMREARVTAIAS